MRIVEVDIREAHDGLHPIQMKRVGEIVLLAGRNGGGKSRIIRTLASYVNSHLSPAELNGVEMQKRAAEQSIEGYVSRARVLEQLSTPSQQDSDNLSQLRRATDQQLAQLATIESQLRRHSALKLDPDTSKATPVLYQVKDTDLIDHGTLRHSEFESASSSMKSEFNIALAKHYGLGALHRFINEYVYAAEPDRAGLEPSMARLKMLLNEFLGTDLTWNASGAKLFGLPIGSAQLSDGQKVLLQIALSLYFQDGSKEGLILFLDEPENHLHPQAVLDVISKIKAACPHAQIWIATHSVHLLAHFDSSAIWYVDGGSIEYAGENSIKVLHSLLGGEKGIDDLAEFLALPTRLAVAKFAAQCMRPPEVADTGPGDPQTGQIIEALRSKLRAGEKLRVLDFGIGKGRLLPALAHEFATIEEFVSSIDFLGFDYQPEADDERLCRERIEAVYGASDGRYFSGYRALDAIDTASIDVIVMCNVLHEIEPDQWLTIFGPEGLLSRIIKPEGALLVVEDQVLKTGERAHSYGYLVLDAIELRELFGETREGESINTVQYPDPPYRGRLKAHAISGRLLRNVTSLTRHAAIGQLLQSAKHEVRDLQGEQYDKAKSRAYAFWAHQFMNASLAAEVF